MKTICYLKKIYKTSNRFYSLSSVYHKQSLSNAPKYDEIGPPDPVTNLRAIKYFIPKNETPLEAKFREQRKEVDEWNDRFWRKHNTDFVKSRETFISNHRQKGDEGLTAEEMSVFYKQFLDTNWKNHVNYNLMWYKKNVGLVLLHLKVKLYKVLRRIS